jgi:hypothetical protein
MGFCTECLGMGIECDGLRTGAKRKFLFGGTMRATRGPVVWVFLRKRTVVSVGSEEKWEFEPSGLWGAC